MPELDWSNIAATVWPLAIALIIGFIVRQVLLFAARRAGRSEQSRAWLISVIAVPAAVAVPLIFLSLAVQVTPLPELWIARVSFVVTICVLLSLVWLVLRVVRAVEGRIMARNPVDVADNLHARRIHTQARVLSRVVQGLVMVVGLAIVLMTIPGIRQVGATILASAGIMGIVVGMAAQPVFGNLIAGLQIALTQPIRLDDVVIVEGEWGRIEEITSAYVIVAIWDQRRLVVPLRWFIENPFQNWTRQSAELLGPVFVWLDYRAPLEPIRKELRRICESDPRWDGRVCVVHVEDITAQTMKVRLLVSARNSGDDYDLRCVVRERMMDFLQREHPEALPRVREVTFEGEERGVGEVR